MVVEEEREVTWKQHGIAMSVKMRSNLITLSLGFPSSTAMLLAIPIFTTLVLPVLAYVPASPTNSTSDAIAGGLNITDISKIHMQWYSNG